MHYVNTIDDIRRILPRAVITGEYRGPLHHIQADSRRVTRGDVFVAIPGTVVDGHRFIPSAIENGAVAVVCSIVPPDADTSVAWIRVDNVAPAYARLCAACFGDPSESMDVVGITGTNGKTTITYILEFLARKQNLVPGVIGTTGYRWPGVQLDASHTTPDACILQRLLADMRSARVTHAFCEFSSHALEQRRVDGTRVTAAVFTNLSQDHLDYHENMESYFLSKSRLLTELLMKNGVAVINTDSVWGQRLAKNVGDDARLITVSVEGAPATLSVTGRHIGIDGSTVSVRMPDGMVRKFHVRMVGAYNLSNALLALAVGIGYGWDVDCMTEALGETIAVPGRMEPVQNRCGIAVFVDYAHTEDGLLNVLSTLRPLVPQRLICIMGCGGDRDSDKRPKMGRAAAQYADVTVITSDNPRTENPGDIIAMIIPGAQQAGRRMLADFDEARIVDGFVVEPDRRLAIEKTLTGIARRGDVVVVAGKGHETYQIVGHTKHDFDDREVAATALSTLENTDD